MESSAFLQQNFLPLLLLIVVGGLVFQPGPVRTATTLPLVGVLFWQFLLLEEKDFFGNHYSLGCATGTLFFTYLDRIVLANPDKEGWHKRTADQQLRAESKAAAPVVPEGFLRRLWWSFCTFIAPRGVGWSYQVKNVPAALPADYPKWKFILRKLLRAAFMFLLQDTLASWTASTRWGSFRDIKGFVPVGFDSSTSYRMRFLLAWIHIVITYAALEMINSVVGVLFVLFHLANPDECPPLFGDLSEMYTLRKAWSVVWHQLMRRICSTGGLFAARDVLHLQKGTFASKYVQLFGGFLISASIHGFASMAYLGELRTSREFSWFTSQALAIMAEDHIIALGRKLGFRDHLAWRILGYVWVILWFGVNTSWTSGVMANGIWNHQRCVDVFGLGPPRPLEASENSSRM